MFKGTVTVLFRNMIYYVSQLSVKACHNTWLPKTLVAHHSNQTQYNSYQAWQPTLLPTTVHKKSFLSLVLNKLTKKSDKDPSW